MTTLTAATTYRTIASRADRAGVSFITLPSPVGLVLVAHETGARALLAVLIGDEEDALRAELQQRFPLARLTREAEGVTATLAQDVVCAIGAPADALALELDARGTEFQQRVWRALREIPAGETTTYTELARRIGAPNAVRAVAGACAANPLAIIVPCHRVVRSDGSPGQYLGGADAKATLIALEAGS